MNRTDKREAEQRLLDALLAEQFGGELATNTDDVRDGREAQELLMAPRTRRPMGSGRRATAWPVAAALLLGVGVVSYAMSTGPLLESRPTHATALQDPKEPELVTAKTVEEFLEYLGQAKRLQLVRKETVGAGRLRDGANGSVDRLDTVRWPQVLRMEGEELDRWRQALRASCRRTEKSQHVDEVYDFELVLPENRLLRAFANFGGKTSRIWIAEDYPMVPDEGLLALIEEASKEVKELRRVALGEVADRDQLMALPKNSQRLHVPAILMADAGDFPCLGSVQRLTLRGQPDAAAWRELAKLDKLQHLELVGATMDDATVQAVVGMSRLRALALRQCMDFSSDDLRALRALRKLRTLHLIDTSPGGEDLELQELASLPVLREFGLRAPHALHDEQLEAIGRTKIERLLLVDLNMQGDLGHLAHLPSLQDLVLVAKVGDSYLEPLSQIASLRLLTVRNAIAGGGFLEAIMSSVPQCKIDWTNNARWWATDYAFRYIERAWPVSR